jgi:hypothetical protein
MSHRDVIQAQGQAGSNHMRTDSVAGPVASLVALLVALPVALVVVVRAAGGVMSASSHPRLA